LKGFDVEVWIFRLSFDEDILAFFGLATVLATFSKIWAIFPQSYGRPGANVIKLFTAVSYKKGCLSLASLSNLVHCLWARPGAYPRGGASERFFK
jgi:hypothetical protein